MEDATDGLDYEEYVEEQVTDSVEGHIECGALDLDCLRELAVRIDQSIGADPSLAEAASAILNGGTAEDIQTAFVLLAGWSFSPEGGWKAEAEAA